MPANTISKGKLHCILVIVILFILTFLYLPLSLIRLANDDLLEDMQSRVIINVSTDGGPVNCIDGFFPCASNKSECVAQGVQCDQKRDCTDGSDEDVCFDTSGAITSIFRHILENRAKQNNSLGQNETSSDDGQFALAIPASCDEQRYNNFSCPCNLTETNIILCANSQLRHMPNKSHDSVFKITMTNNAIETIDNVDWPSSLALLVLRNNSISEIGERTFETAPNLAKLYLNLNRIERIHPMAFSMLHHLTVLQLNENQLSEFSPKLLENKSALIQIQMDNNKLDLDPDISFSVAPGIAEIHLDSNRITRIRRHHFSNMSRLFWLSLENNQISSIELNSFENNYALVELNLSSNQIKVIDKRIFAHRLNIQALNLSANPLETLPVDAFRELLELTSLHMVQIEFHEQLDIETFAYLRHLNFVYFEDLTYCAYVPRVRVCRPLTDGVSNLKEMLALPILKDAVSLVAYVCILGNVMVLIWRTLSAHEDRTLSLFVRNLSIADLMMGIYLYKIAMKDKEFEHEYQLHAARWMASWQCQAIGSLAVLSSELSVFLLTIITIERYRAISSIRQFEPATFMRRARIWIALAWFVSALIAFYPLLDAELLRGANEGGESSLAQGKIGGYYANNGLCLPLHIDQPYLRGWQYSAFVYLVVNFPAVILMIYLYARMYMLIIDGHQTARPHLLGGERREEAILAIRFFFIVVTDCLCLIPVVVIKMLAFKMDISPAIYSWLVVFIIPINSALNPIIYTLANPSTLFCRLLGRIYQTLDSACDQLDGRLRLMAGALRAACQEGLRAQARRANCRPVRTSRGGSNYSSSRSSTSLSNGSEAQLMSSAPQAGGCYGGRRRAKANSSSTTSTSTGGDHFESSPFTRSTCSSKSSFESTTLMQPAANSTPHRRQQPQQHHHMLNVQMDLSGAMTAAAGAGNTTTHLELTLVSADEQYNLLARQPGGSTPPMRQHKSVDLVEWAGSMRTTNGNESNVRQNNQRRATAFVAPLSKQA